MDTKSLEKLIKTLRKNGISHYKCADFEFSLTPTPEKTRRVSSKAAAKEEAMSLEQLFTEEQALFWSSAGIPETTEAQ